MSWACRGCGNNRRRVAPGHKSCKGRRLCQIISIAALDRNPNHPLQWYLDRERDVQQGYVGLVQLTKNTQLPDTPIGFMELIRSGHGRLFRAEESIAGRFRTIAEQAEFGTTNLVWRGSAPHKIEAELHQLWTKVSEVLARHRDRETACQVAAFFLERFFMIHPFVDGNGRVARSIVGMIFRACGSYDLKTSMRLNARDKRKYIKALNYAHLHAPTAPEEVEECKRYKRPRTMTCTHGYLVPLTRVLETWILEVKLDEELEEVEPTSHDIPAQS